MARGAMIDIQFGREDSAEARLEKLRRLAQAVQDIARQQTQVTQSSGSGSGSPITMTGPALLGRLSGTGEPNSLPGDQATTLLSLFSEGNKGLVPSPGSATATRFLRDDGAWSTISLGTGSFADPAVEVGLTMVPGTAVTAMRSDGAPALSQAIAPSWTGVHQFTLATQFADGTAGAPGLTFISDLDTGVFRSAEDELSLATGGVQRWYVDASGRLISSPGVTVPAALLASDPVIISARDSQQSLALISAGTGISLGYRFVSAGGTIAAPTAVTTADISYMSFLGAGGYDGTNWQVGSAALFGIRPDGTWNGTSRPTKLTFETTASGSTTRTMRAQILNGGEMEFTESAYFGVTKAEVDGVSGLGLAGTAWYALTRGRMARVGAGPSFEFIRVNTSLAAPSTVALNDTLGAFTFNGYDSATVAQGAQVASIATEAWTGSARGSEVRVLATRTGSTTLATSLIMGADYVRGPDGTAALPGFSFGNDTDTGIFRAGANALAFAAQGTRMGSFQPNGVNTEFRLQSTNPADLGGVYIRFMEDDGTTTKGFIGFASSADDDIDITNSETDANIVLATAGLGRVLIPVGTVARPGLSFNNGDTDTGLWRSAADTVSIVGGGVEVFGARLSGTTRLAQIGDGSDAGEFHFRGAAGNNRSFLFYTGTSSLRWVVRANSTAETGSDAGSNFDIVRSSDAAVATNTLRILRSNGQFQFEDGSNTAPILSFANDPDTGVYRVGANNLGIATGGVRAIDIDSSQRVGINRAAVGGWQLTAAGTAGSGAILVEDTAVADGATPFGWMRSNTSRLEFGTSNRSGAGTTGSTVHMLLTGAGEFLIGSHTTALSAISGATAYTPTLQKLGNSVQTASGLFARFQASTAGPNVQLAKGRSNTIGNFATVLDGDTLGILSFAGADSAAFSEAARFSAEVDGTPAAGFVPGRLVFFTTAAGTTPTERLRIAANGAWGLAGATYGTSGQVLTSNGSGGPPTWQSVAGGLTGLANPTASVGLAAVNGVATTAMRSDGAPALSQSIAPTWSGQHIWSLSLRGPDGSAGTPAFNFSNDTDCGMYRVTTNEIAWATAGTQRLVLTSDGRFYGTALHNNAGAVTGTANQYLASGTYTPTATAELNLDSVTGNACQWIRVGNVVTVSGSITIDPTASAASTTFRITLPIASNLGAVNNLGGAGAQNYTAVPAVFIRGDTANDAAQFVFQSGGSASSQIYFQFQYVVL